MTIRTVKLATILMIGAALAASPVLAQALTAGNQGPADIPANRELLGPRQVFSGEEAAADAIRAALADPALREELLAEQRARAAGRGAARMVERYAELYSRCAAPERAVQPWPHAADPRTIERTWS